MKLGCDMPTKKVVVILLAVATAGGVYAMSQLLARPAAGTLRPVSATVKATGSPVKSSRSESKAEKTSLADAMPVALQSEPSTNSTPPDALIEAFTEPYRDIPVAAAEMGTLSDVKVREGDVIQKGDVIAVLHDDVLRASLEVARRSMSVEGLLNSARADLEMKKSEHEKLLQLRNRNHASQQEVDRIVTELKVSEARLLSVREDLEIKQLEFRRIESQLEQRVVRAPIDGVVSDVLREPGEFVSPTDPAIIRLVQLDSLLIVFSVPLAQRNQIEKGQTVSLAIGPANEITEGIVEHVSPTPDTSNSSVRVKVRLPNSDHRFQSGERTVLTLNAAGRPSSAPVQPESTPVARREQ